MADQTEKPKLGTRPPLGLKRTVETGKVKQSFSHGRSNTVVVEVKKRRILGRPGEAPPGRRPSPSPKCRGRRRSLRRPRRSRKPSAAATTLPRARRCRPVLLREAEEARMSSLEDARRREDHAKIAAKEEERRRAEENRRAEEAAAEEAARRAEEEALAADRSAGRGSRAGRSRYRRERASAASVDPGMRPRP